MLDNEARLRELSLKAIDGAMSDEEFAELAQLSRAKQKARQDRLALIAGLKESLQRQGITISELFSTTEISAAVAQMSSATRRTATVRPKNAGGSGSGTWVRQKQGSVLVEISKPGMRGLPSRYCKGQRMGYYVPKTFKDLDDGQLEANLDRYTTAAGKEYFASDEGRAERAQLLDSIRTRKVKPPWGR